MFCAAFLPPPDPFCRTLSFGGDDQDQDVFDEILLYPLLYSFFLIVDAILLTALFHYLARFDPPHEVAEYANEEAKRAAEIAAEEAGESAAMQAAHAIEDGSAEEEDGIELTGGAVEGASAPVDGGGSPHATAEAGGGPGTDTPSLVHLITHTNDSDEDEATPAAEVPAAEGAAGGGGAEDEDISLAQADSEQGDEGSDRNDTEVTVSSASSTKSGASVSQVAPGVGSGEAVLVASTQDDTQE